MVITKPPTADFPYGTEIVLCFFGAAPIPYNSRKFMTCSQTNLVLSMEDPFAYLENATALYLSFL
jgi:hypothetical protein